jgi:hypothetical protein
MFAMNSDLYFDEIASWPAFSSTSCLDCSTSRSFAPPLVLLGEQAGLPAEVRVRHGQLGLLRAELLRQGLGLLEQVLGQGVGLDGVEDEADALGQLVEERLVDRTDGGERGQLDHGAHRPLEQDRQDDDVQRRGVPETRADPHVVVWHLREQDPLLLLGALADQTLAEAERRRQVLALLVAVSRLELEHGLAAVQGLRHRVEDPVLRVTSRASSDRIMFDVA